MPAIISKSLQLSLYIHVKYSWPNGWTKLAYIFGGNPWAYISLNSSVFKIPPTTPGSSASS